MRKNIDIKKIDPKPILPKPEKDSFLTEEKKKDKQKKGVFTITAVFLLILLFIIAGYFFLKKEITTPLDPKLKEEKIVDFNLGESTKDIAKKLKEAGIIKNEIYFLIYIFKTQKTDQLQAGKYSFSPSMSIPEIAQKMEKGEVVPNDVKITIPEGFRLSQIEERVNSEFNKVIKRESKIKISEYKTLDFKKEYPFLKDAPENATLEGYLFPDTYLFFNGEEMTNEEIEREIIAKMLSNFNDKLTPDLIAEIKKQKKTIFEIITMASILEKEVKTKGDREIVSGIFWKRIEEGTPLESCATIAYILGKDKWRYSFEDTRVKSPYNTYLNRGLPKGPISNPGLESIRAAIYPKKSEYNYFLNDPKTGKTIFSKTLKEHNQNKAIYLK